MKISNFTLFNIKGGALIVCGFLSMFGMVGTASAELGCVTGDGDTSHYTLLIDASSSCSNLSAGMYGCEVDGAGACRITHGMDGRTIDIEISGGSVGGNEPINWEIIASSDGISLVDLGIMVGATNGGSCGTVYTPGAREGFGLIFKKSETRNQKVNKLSFCSDFIQPAAAEPHLVVTKTVMPVVGINCDEDSTETLDIAVGDTVTYCYEVKNDGAGEAISVTLVDDKNPDGPNDLLTLTFPNNVSTVGNLDSGATAFGTLDVPIGKAGTVVNTATAEAFGLKADGTIGTKLFKATDIATVNAAIVAESCPASFQGAINALSQSTGLDFAFLLDPNRGGRVSVCTPDSDGTGGTTAAASRTQCIDQCITKTECQNDPNADGCAYSVCEASGAWTTDAGTADCEVATPQPGVLPYCWEVQSDLKKICPDEPTKWEPQEETVLNIKKGSVNPYIYQSCYSSGGRYICETICFPFFAGDVCP